MRAVSLFLVLVLSACAPFGDPKPAHRYFVLEPELGNAEIAFRVGSVGSASFYDTDAMVYSRGPATRGYYQQNSWTEVPAQRIADVIRQRSSGSGPVVDVHLVEMFHDASGSPGRVRVSLAAQRDGSRRTFTAEAPAASFDAAGAVRGFNAATGKIIAEIAAWAAP